MLIDTRRHKFFVYIVNLYYIFININNIITTFKYVSYIFVAVGILTVALCLLVLYFDIAIPNELKGFVFFAQVILNNKQCLV